jgi:hypothetical protein
MWGLFVFGEYRREGKSGGRDEFCAAKRRLKPTLVLFQAVTQYDPYDTTDYHAEDAFENYHVRYSLKRMDSKKGIRNRSKTANSSAQRGRCNP